MRIASGKQIVLRDNSLMCEDCVQSLWVDFIYNYRVHIAERLPAADRRRPICPQGRGCKLQVHEDHNKSFNHIL